MNFTFALILVSLSFLESIAFHTLEPFFNSFILFLFFLPLVFYVRFCSRFFSFLLLFHFCFAFSSFVFLHLFSVVSFFIMFFFLCVCFLLFSFLQFFFLPQSPRVVISSSFIQLSVLDFATVRCYCQFCSMIFHFFALTIPLYCISVMPSKTPQSF